MLKVQLYYLIDQTAAAFLGLLAVFVAAAILVASDAGEGMLGLDLNRAERAFSYRNECLVATRLGTVLAAIFLGMHGFSRAARRPAVFFVASRADVPRFAAAKAVAGIALLSAFGLFCFSFQAVLGAWATPYFALARSDLAAVFDVLCGATFFFLFQASLTIAADSVFAAIPSFTLAWLLETESGTGTVLADVLTLLIRHGGFGSGTYVAAGDGAVQLGTIAFLFLLTVSLFSARDVN